MENNSVNEGLKVAEYIAARGQQPTVYQEVELQPNVNGLTRIWLSFDIDNDPQKVKRTALYDWLNKQNQIESWGNSVATFLVGGYATTDHDVVKFLVDELINAKVLDKNKWDQTPDISLYVFYESRRITVKNMGRFILIQNATIKQPNGFKC